MTKDEYDDLCEIQLFLIDGDMDDDSWGIANQKLDELIQRSKKQIIKRMANKIVQG
ncbi:hypothetical protein LCGC14_1544920 [marine sediment metagenome]|uniref:Uncharacterized protein n=1 Tax=marine sediment metagenome TaxID=412755 RepID=A0A0F9IRZ5_9ZZZZ